MIPLYRFCDKVKARQLLSLRGQDFEQDIDRVIYLQSKIRLIKEELDRLRCEHKKLTSIIKKYKTGE